MWIRLGIGLLAALLTVLPARASIELNNHGFSQDGIERVVSNAREFPTESFTVTWAVYHEAVSATGYKTYFCFCQTSFGGGDEYTVAFATNPNVLGHGQFGIGSQGSDTYSGGDEPAAGRWYFQAYRVRKRATNDYEQLFYYDLPDLAKVVSRDRTSNLTPINSTTRISFGTPPYTTNEGLDGWMANVKVFDFAVPTGSLHKESRSWMVMTANLESHLWGQWPMRHTGDIKDVSGHGRHLRYPTLTNSLGVRGAPPGLRWREPLNEYAFDGPAPDPVTGCLMLQNIADNLLLQNGTDGFLLQGGGGTCGGGGGGPVPAGFKQRKYQQLMLEPS
jgi:hypothetical protein